MTRRRKVLLTLASVVVGLIAAALVTLYIIGRDESPPDDSMLILHRADVPDEENGFTYILQAQDALYWPVTKAWKDAALHPLPTEDSDGNAVHGTPETEASDAVKEKVEAMAEGKAWDDGLAAEIMERNATTCEILKKAMACRECQGPEITDISMQIPWVFDHLAMARMMALRSRALLRQGKAEEALDQAVDVVQFGQAVERSKCGVVAYLVGATVKQMGLEALRSELKEAAVPPERLKALADRLATYADSSQGLVDALRVEYEVDWHTARDAAENLPAKGSGSNARDPRILRRWQGLVRFGIVWKPNQTQRWFVDALRPGVEQADKPLREINWAIDKHDDQPSLPRRILSGNLLGQWLYRLMVPGVAKLASIRCQDETNVAMTRTLVALKAFKTKTGRLPLSLDELVPDYLPAVPLDDFDGKPIRYSAAKKAVYSVGKDAKDDGGMTRDEACDWWNKNRRLAEEEPVTDAEDVNVWDLPDPSYPIDF